MPLGDAACALSSENRHQQEDAEEAVAAGSVGRIGGPGESLSLAVPVEDSAEPEKKKKKKHSKSSVVARER